ncbi:Hypothetical protein, putative [Bodo saltans]|uniref:Membrane-associated protein n=1 Tax=Bodo saltans TaxID=75058 RepID=A0A0S4J9B6_BODSA|nr:Hypothetical protein, putative [Bodo saltans]|eukprot:CUG84645.1 Hypothetical protein, putative [Bodo saltans]
MIVIGGLYVLRCFLFISLQKSVAHARLSYCHFYFLEILFDVSAAVPVTGTFHRRRAFKGVAGRSRRAHSLTLVRCGHTSNRIWLERFLCIDS